jgi:putative salt-induced outer membrane protein YdiY
MRPISHFSLETHTGPYDQWSKHTRLFANSKDTAQLISGYVIEAQYKCAAGYLIITSYDCLFEEANTFVLLNDRYETIATHSLGAMYNSYLLESHLPLDDHSLALDYGDGVRYVLAVRQKPLGGVKLVLEREV